MQDVYVFYNYLLFLELKLIPSSSFLIIYVCFSYFGFLTYLNLKLSVKKSFKGG